MTFQLAKIPLDMMPMVTVVRMANKPILAVAMENPRISQYPEEVRNINTLSFIEWALDMLGVNHKEGGEGHHVAVHQFVNTQLSNYTYQELRQAILMYVTGEFNQSGIMVTQQFNCVVLGKVMNVYDEHKQQALYKYNRLKRDQQAEEVELTEEQKMELTLQGVQNCFNEYVKTNTIIPGYIWVYDYLTKQNVLSNSDDEKKTAYKEAKLRLQLKKRPEGMSRNDYKNFRDSLEQNKSDAVVVEAKKDLLCAYFNKLTVRHADDALTSLINKIKEQQ